MNILTMSQQKGLAEKVIAITGASSGIGEATARFLATKGSKVVLGARRIENLKTIAEEIQSAGGDVCFTSLDVTKKEQLEKFIQFAQAQFGRVDVLVSNAGLMPLSLLEQLKVEEWERMIDVNLKGVLYGIAAALPVFKAQNSGHFINITSIADRWVGPTSTIYSATKHAVRVVSEGLRQEMGNTIRVTIIAPGATESELPNTISDSEMKKTVIEQFRIDLIPAEAIARAIAYAVEQPADVDVNEIVVRPTAQKY
ncbi:short-chain dehydrogenase/oxidoreductase protein [Gloeomargarita lithophora Alchichica-D10]|uniref:Short-chain dehydrogenase/oxidoreductase protein n=1 Tax=Gloeomargarita lithophora Alchichica-D10 TaxID=1188229 RepID=A0A1J0AE28_9CYAN|nr:SDR family oxidoreductase [Gloeomargarita lithophora]APB34159.1 short-chain dehydrogenase/oxidoreductase protein [Gloeomargarita lithophora Alchichica-D10]